MILNDVKWCGTVMDGDGRSVTMDHDDLKTVTGR
jgi:hypothetical protein